jgi:RsiW-degrading membrane proteinase PrsW (M82 family)
MNHRPGPGYTDRPVIRYRSAVAVTALGLGAVVWAILAGPRSPGLPLFVAGSAVPLAVLLAVRAKLLLPFPGRAFLGGGTVGPMVALASHAFVGAFAVAFFLGFARSGTHLLESLRADPRLTAVLASPWVILLLVEVSLVAPLTEEAGKALGAAFSRPENRGQAFLAGVAAGTGFAVVENLLYAGLGATMAGPWPAIAATRSLGAAVHPLASGIVMLGWWEWRHERDLSRLAKRFVAGAGIHALWNGAVVALIVADTAAGQSAVSRTVSGIALAYIGALGVSVGAALWTMTAGLADGERAIDVRFSDARAVGGWIVLAASLLVPVVILLLAFPGFYLG